VLAEDTVSRAHCEIMRDTKGYLLRDLRSTNGTFLDGAEVREAYLRAGAVIGAGAVHLRFQPLEEVVEVVASKEESFGDLLGRSLPMREVFFVCQRVADSDTSVVIEGEAGTGKRLLARAIHLHSAHSRWPLVIVDCAALGDSPEIELFGLEKGDGEAAAEGEVPRRGLLEKAHRGTLLLDRVEELPLELQARLARSIEQRELRRLGASRAARLDARLLASTTRPLRAEIEKGKFREDLYFRLAGVTISLAPLRERLEDVPLLARAFAAAEGAEAGLSEPLLALLASHDWPGNVTELRSVVERLAVPEGPEVAGDILRAVAGGEPSLKPPLAFTPGRSFRVEKERAIDEFERRYVRWLLARAGSNISRAAREADMDRKYLHKLIRKH
jgi:DNA-binding NtrC family response regulator